MSTEWRERFYTAYASSAACNEYAWSEDEYRLFSRVNERRYLGLLPADRQARILDVACGAGHFLYFLQKTAGFSNAEGIDISAEQTSLAEKMGLSNLVTGDFMAHLGSNPERYDLITAHHFIEHLNKAEALDFLEAVKVALKPGGRVIVTTGNVGSLFGASHICSDFTHEGGFTARSLGQLLKTLDFQGVEIKGLGPVAYDLRSRIRLFLWKMIRNAIGFYLSVERGRGRVKERPETVLELDILGTGSKRRG